MCHGKDHFEKVCDTKFPATASALGQPRQQLATFGIPDHLIQALGRWTSNAYQLYIRTPSEALTGISVSWLDIVCPCHWLSTAPSTLRSSLAPNIIAWGLPCSFWCCSHCQLLSFGKCVCFSMHRRFHFTPVRWPLLFQAPRRSRLGGGRLQSCHGYLLLMLEHCPAPPTLQAPMPKLIYW